MIGTILNNRYRLDKELGSGGFATVYAGYDLLKKRQVAIKITNDVVSRNNEHLKKSFEDELSALVERLPPHPNIIRIYDQGEVNQKIFLVMDYAPHGTLEARLQENAAQPLDFTLAGRFFVQMADALAHAHQNNIVHRDVKPENMLFIEPNRLVVSDFGLARQFRSQMTQSMNLFGSPPYVAPERWADKVGPASDVYALGIILYQMLTGKLPFQASDPLAYLRLHVDEPAPRLRLTRPDLPVGLDELLHAMLAKQPEQRPPSGELVRRYQQALQQAVGYYQTQSQPQQSAPVARYQPPIVSSAASRPITLTPDPGPVRAAGRPLLGADTLPPAAADNSPDVQYWSSRIHTWAGVAENFVKRARAYLKVVAHYKAIADFSEALKLDPQNSTIYYERGKVYAEVRQYREAIADFNQAIKLAPQFPDAYEQRANAYQAIGQHTRAIQDFEAALRFNSPHLDVYNKRTIAYKQRAEAHLANKDYREAISDYDQAIALNPRDARLYNERGNAYRGLGKHKQASASYTKAIKLNLKHAEVYMNLGDAFLEMKKYSKAVGAYSEALKLPGWTIEVYKNRGYAYFCLRKFRQAISDYNQALLLRPNDAMLLCQRGHIHLANRGYQQALADYDEALRLDPSDLGPLYNRAMALAALGRIPDALQSLRYQLSKTKERNLQKMLRQAITQLENIANQPTTRRRSRNGLIF